MEIMRAYMHCAHGSSAIDRKGEFTQRCVSIYERLCPFGKTDKVCYVADSYTRTFEDGYQEWVLTGRYGDVMRIFNHYPTDAEINNAICSRFNMRRECYIL